MASPIWIGGAPAVAQIDTVAIPADIEAGQTVTFTIGNKTLSVTLTGATQSVVVAELVAAWNASTIPEFTEITASVGADANDEEDGTINLTSRTAGKPFAVTTSIGSGNNEKQVITLGGTAATGGTFTLTYNDETTTPIAYNASAATVQSALEGLASYSSGDFTVTGSVAGPWTVEFTGVLAGTNVSIMTIDVSGLTGGVNEVQTITSPSNPTGGTFTLTFNGETTAAIAHNANAATIEAALEALSSIPSGSVSCSSGSLPGTDVTVTFQDELASLDVSQLIVDSNNLTGITGSAAEITPGGSSIGSKTKHYFDFGDTSTAAADYYKDTVDGSVSLREANNISGDLTRISGGKIDYGIKTVTGTGYVRGASTGLGSFEDTENYSISIWFKATTSNDGTICGVSRSTGEPEWEIRLNYSDSTVLFTRKKGTSFNPHEAKSSGTFSINTWHHVVGVWDATNGFIRISLDGAAFDSVAATGTNPGLSSAYFTAIRLESGSRHLGASSSLKGFIDSIGIYDDALTISEVGDIYNSGAGDDYPFPAAGNNEIQELTLTGSPSAGNIYVSFQGAGVDIPYDATASEAESLLESIPTIGAGNVNVTGGDWPETALVVEFINDLAITNVELLEIDTSSLVMTVSETTKGVTNPTGTVETTVTPLSQSTTTPNSGPHCWDVPANWNTNTVPASSDTVYIADSDINILYGLDQSEVTLADLHVEQTFTGDIGLPRINTDGGTGNSYYDYRETYLKIGATELFIGDKEGDGSERLKINLGSVQSTVLITNSGESSDGNTPPILLLGTHANNEINVNRGFLGVAYYPTEVSTVATLRQAFFDDTTDDTTVYLGSGVTVTNITKTGGVLDINSGTTAFQQTAGTTTIHDGAHTVLNTLAGLVNYNSTGTLATANLSGDAVLVFDQDARPKDVTVINKYSDDSEVFDESGCVTSPVIQMHNCGDMSTLHMGKDFKLTFSATT